MSTFGAVSTAARRAPMDPTKHVNYELGMVLGVDDFTQEFAYLSERDRWMARDLLGYGTVWGLAVSKGLGARGPEVRVSQGVAVSPRGQLLRVAPAQCASLDDWLGTRTQQVTDRLAGTPAGTPLKVYVVLGYDACTTDPVPIPGEPCRSESDSMKDSRIADSFKLELSFDAPRQFEEDALRDLVRWLRANVQVSPTPGTSLPLKDFQTALLDAAKPSPPVEGEPVPPPPPPGSPPDTLRDPPSPLVVFADDLCTWLRVALRVWVTELWPGRRTNWLGETNSCVERLPSAPPGGEDSVLLAELDLPVVRELGGGPWKISSRLEDLVIEEGQRPFLVHLRLLQEWLLCGLRPTAPAAPTSGVSVVAAGLVRPTVLAPSFNGLKTTATADGSVTLTFDGYRDPTAQGFQYVVKALLASSNLVNAPVVTFGGFQANGFVLNVSDQGTPVPQATLDQLQLVVEVSRYEHG